MKPVISPGDRGGFRACGAGPSLGLRAPARGEKSGKDVGLDEAILGELQAVRGNVTQFTLWHRTTGSDSRGSVRYSWELRGLLPVFGMLQ